MNILQLKQGDALAILTREEITLLRQGIKFGNSPYIAINTIALNESLYEILTNAISTLDS